RQAEHRREAGVRCIVWLGRRESKLLTGYGGNCWFTVALAFSKSVAAEFFSSSSRLAISALSAAPPSSPPSAVLRKVAHAFDASRIADLIDGELGMLRKSILVFADA